MSKKNKEAKNAKKEAAKKFMIDVHDLIDSMNCRPKSVADTSTFIHVIAFEESDTFEDHRVYVDFNGHVWFGLRDVRDALGIDLYMVKKYKKCINKDNVLLLADKKCVLVSSAFIVSLIHKLERNEGLKPEFAKCYLDWIFEIINKYKEEDKFDEEFDEEINDEKVLDQLKKPKGDKDDKDIDFDCAFSHTKNMIAKRTKKGKYYVSQPIRVHSGDLNIEFEIRMFKNKIVIETDAGKLVFKQEK